MRQTRDTDAVRLLANHPRDRRVMLAGQHKRLHTEEAVLEILSHARAHRCERPDRAADWASLAWYAATRLHGTAGRELQAMAQAEEGNARRLLGQWARAETRFRQAASLLTGSPDSRATLEVRLLAASYHLQREQWIHALDCLADAGRLAELHEDQEAAYRVTLKRGLVQRERRRWAEAVALFRSAYRLAETQAHRVGAIHNSITTYVDGGWYPEAMEVYSVARPCYEGCPLHLQARGDWVRGRIQLGLGDFRAAAESLGEARERLTSGSYHWEVAELLCDEAEARLRLGDLEEVGRLAGASEAAYRAMGMAQGARRAASLLRSAAGGALAAIELMRRRLRRYRSVRRAA